MIYNTIVTCWIITAITAAIAILAWYRVRVLAIYLQRDRDQRQLEIVRQRDEDMLHLRQQQLEGLGGLPAIIPVKPRHPNRH